MCTQEMMESGNKVGRQSFRRRFHTPSYLRSVRHVWYNKDSELFNATGVVSFGYFRPLPSSSLNGGVSSLTSMTSVDK